MNTKENAIKEILLFLDSDERFLLLTGTFQNRKHILALQLILSTFPTPTTILFRAGHSSNFETFLRPVISLQRKPKTGTPIRIKGGYNLYVDTINSKSWGSTPRNLDVAVVYPLDALNEDNGDDCVQDLIRRNTRKILLISWTDNKDFFWVEQFDPRHVSYDAEEERPDYHKEMLKLVSEKSKPKFVWNLPQYAKSIDPAYLIKIWCRDCNNSRWARLNKPFPGKTTLNEASFGEYEARCLICDYRATDNYNWSR